MRDEVKAFASELAVKVRASIKQEEPVKVISNEKITTVMQDLGYKLRSSRLAFTAMAMAVRETEAKAAELKMTGEEKRELVVQVINDLVDIPILPEWCEAKRFGYLVDFAIEMVNQVAGHAWGKKPEAPPA